MFKTLFLSMSAVVLCFSTTMPRAADFYVKPDPTLDQREWSGCDLAIIGTLTDGDQHQLERNLVKLLDHNFSQNAFLPNFLDDLEENYILVDSEITVCLNLEGGSLRIASAMIDVLHETGFPAAAQTDSRRTLIKSGHRCNSACAVFFMGGFYFWQGSTFNFDPFREIEWGAELGFHAPSLLTDFSSANLGAMSAVYDKAVSHLRDLWSKFSKLDLARHVEPEKPEWLSNWLFIRMVSTPPSEMYYINTPERVYRAGIGLVDSDLIAKSQLDQGHFETICNNVHNWIGASNSNDTQGVSRKIILEHPFDDSEGGGVKLTRGDVNYRNDIWETCMIRWPFSDSDHMMVEVNGPKRVGGLEVRANAWIHQPSNQELWELD